ncbi:hypothetical protein [Erythrobacter sp. SAORIC-644]|uniref:hypothetical protein n=1 Tax=Erythrobacter sp. SAORIC-644 TaxID=1869314 RepID=UPI001304ACCF|nr:hypothetical protein [Erythrobacter sp. SAORIC-644]
MLAVLELDRDAAPLRIDPDHTGSAAIEASRAPVVADQMDAVAGAQLPLDPDERFRHG